MDPQINLSPKLSADYAELVNQYLDKIPVEDEHDFSVVVEALKAIIEQNQNHEIPEHLEGRIKSIQELVENPELYASPENIDGFKKIVLLRVSGKIQEFVSLSKEEKTAYISQQKSIRQEAETNKLLMSAREPPKPGSDAHVLSEREWLRELSGGGIRSTVVENFRTLQLVDQILQEAETRLQEVFVGLKQQLEQPESQYSIENMFKQQFLYNRESSIREKIKILQTTNNTTEGRQRAQHSDTQDLPRQVLSILNEIEQLPIQIATWFNLG